MFTGIATSSGNKRPTTKHYAPQQGTIGKALGRARFVQLSDQAALEVHGGLLWGATGEGILASGSTARLVGVRLAQVDVATSDGSNGIGVWSLGGKLQVIASRIQACHGAAISMLNGHLEVESSAVVGTLASKATLASGSLGPEIAYGIVAVGAKQLHISHSVVADNALAGVFLDGDDPVGAKLVSSSMVTANAYGVALQNAALLKTEHSLILGNTIQNRSGQLGLSVPAPPTFVLGSGPSE
ncbi:MAG: hypothetical protein EXR77_13715 [Myxococcales bacterium]|nr:hypothetical protein [Myxococcales bacterium]